MALTIVTNYPKKPTSTVRGLGLVLTLIGIASGCYRETIPMMQVIQGRTMGTTYSVKFTAEQRAPILLSVSQRIEDELEAINKLMSTYSDTSEISRFNQSTSTDWIPVSPATANVVRLALEVSEETQGAFDVTVGELVELWGFGTAEHRTTIPTEEQIQSHLRQVGYRRLHVRIDPPALRKDLPELAVDLSAIAPGYAVDRIAQLLAESAIHNFFIELGGEVLTRGKRLDGRPWQVGIELPDETRRALFGSLELTDKAVSTSGDYRSFYELDGQRYSHTIDPRSGRPTQHNLASATVVDDSCAKADAIATGLLTLGYEEGLRISNERGWKAFLIRRDSTDSKMSFESGSSVAFDAELTVKVAK